MKLTDREILELNALCGAVVDGTLSDAQRRRLEAWLRDSEVARRYYVRALGQSASLHTYAAEMHVDAPDRPRTARVVRWTFVALSAAAALIAAVWLAHGAGAARTPAGPSVARVTGASEARWRNGDTVVPGEHLALGQRIELATGLAEITFDSGARLLVRPGTSLDLNSAWDATLRRGTVRATVPPQAIGFRVANRAVEVIDLGTEFSMTAESRAAEVLVLKGEVEAAPHDKSDADTILLRANEGRRFAADGVTLVADREQKLVRAQESHPLRRFVAPLRYTHWSFDETGGSMLEATAVGVGKQATEATLELQNAEVGTRGQGRQGRALRFGDQVQARGRVSGLSGGAPHTIAFWVKVPVDAALTDAYAMVAWATHLPQLGSRPVQISWNRRPAEGTLGALRTDFGGGCAIGKTSLRDGRWHHVAVLFSPGDGTVPVQVKQYVDGRLESGTIIPGTIRAPAGTGDAAALDVLWLGCRLTGHKQRDHFRGDMDELYVVDGTLEPDEIVQLFRENQLAPNTAVAMLGSAGVTGR